MSHFYGTLKGARGEATRCGAKYSGMRTVAASWNGAIEVQLWHDSTTGADHFRVRQMPWCGSGISETLAQGILGKPAESQRCPHGMFYSGAGACPQCGGGCRVKSYTNLDEASVRRIEGDFICAEAEQLLAHARAIVAKAQE